MRKEEEASAGASAFSSFEYHLSIRHIIERVDDIFRFDGVYIHYFLEFLLKVADDLRVDLNF